MSPTRLSTFLATEIRLAPVRPLLIGAGFLVLLGAAWMYASLELSRSVLESVRISLYGGESGTLVNWMAMHIPWSVAYGSVGLGCFAILFAAVGFCIGLLRDLLFERISLAILLSLRQRILRGVHQSPWPTLLGTESGVLNKRFFQDVSAVRQLLVECILQRIVDVFLLLACLAFLLQTSISAACTALTLVVLHTFISSHLARFIEGSIRRLDQSVERLWSALSWLLEHRILARLSSAEPAEMGKIKAALADETNDRLHMSKVVYLDKALTNLLHFASPILAMVVIVAVDAKGIPNLESFLIISMILAMMFQAADNLTAVFIDLNRIRVAVENLQHLLDTPIEKVASLSEVPPVNSCLDIRQLSFSHGPDGPHFDIDRFSLRTGERVALLGPSGIGKSTLLELIFGLYSDYQGQLQLRNQVLSGGSSPPTWRQNIGFLPADAILAADTLGENACYGLMPGPVRPSIADVLADLGLDNRLETGSSRLADRLSTGEIRRLQLARIVHGQFYLNLLDEPVAPLAPEDRCRVMQQVLNSLPNESACLVVTHQTDILPLFDRVLVMARGADGRIRLEAHL